MARYLALDWDQNQLHVVAANIRGTSVQVQRAAVWQEGRVPNPADAEELGQLLRDRLKEAGISAAPVLACVGRDRVIVKEVRFPQVPETEEPAIVRFQAVKELTDAAEDVVIDYAVSGTNGNGERKAAALVVRKELLATYQKLCQAAGLKLAALTPRLIGSAACVRQVMGKTVVTPPPEPADAVIAVVVIGEKTAELCVMKDQTFLLARSLPSASNLASDIRRNLAVHAGQQPQQPVRAVYLAGKGAGELRERLAELVDEVPIHTFDPFAGSEASELPAGNRGTFAGAVGLLACKAAGPMPINFVSPRQPRPPANPAYRRYRAALVGWAVLVLGLVGLGQVAAGMKNAEADRLEGQRQAVASQLTKEKERAKNLKALDDWDVPVVEDEFYDLTALIPDVNLLRITSVKVEPLSRSANSKFASKMTLTGKLLDQRNPRKPLDELIANLMREGHYSPQAPRVESDSFTLVVNVERRGPDDYKARLPGEKPVEKAKDKEKAKDAGKGKAGKEKEAGKAKAK